MAKGQNTPITDIIQLDASIPAKMAKQTTYNIDGRNFIVTPVFHEDGRESFGSILMILSILVDTFFTRISMPKQQHPEIHSISVV